MKKIRKLFRRLWSLELFIHISFQCGTFCTSSTQLKPTLGVWSGKVFFKLLPRKSSHCTESSSWGRSGWISNFNSSNANFHMSFSALEKFLVSLKVHPCSSFLQFVDSSSPFKGAWFGRRSINWKFYFLASGRALVCTHTKARIIIKYKKLCLFIVSSLW